MAAFLDNVRFSPTAGGTTDWTVSTAVTGYQTPAAAGAVNGRAYKYFAISADGSQWELGEGVYNTTGPVLPRTTIIASTNANAKVTFSTAPTVAIVAVKEDLISIEEANSFTKTQKAQARANIAAGSFSAHKNAVDQTGITSGVYTKVTFPTKLFDPDGCFDNTTNHRWTPPAGKVMLTAALWVTGTWSNANTQSAQIYKNGSPFKGGFMDGGVANDATIFSTIIDDANGTDFYEVYVNLNTSSGTATVKGSAIWTYFMGTVL